MLRDLLLFSFLLVSSATVFAQNSAGGLDVPAPESSVELERPSEKNKYRKVGWNLEFATLGESENKDEAIAIKTELGLDIEFNFSKYLQLKLKPEASVFSSRSQNRFDDDDFDNRISLNEAYLRLTPLNYLSISGGSHSQKFIDQPQLISRSRSFPGLILQYSPFAGDDHKPVFSYQEAVPTSYTYNAYREDKEALPGLRVFDATVKSKWSKDLTTHLQAGQLSWRNLPTKVAFSSARMGNSFTGELAPGTRFAYGFNTNYLLAQADYCEKCTYGAFATFRKANNSAAPSDSADAQLLGAGLTFRTKDSFTRVFFAEFFSESDVTPALYAASSWGKNNRQGSLAEVEVEIPSFDLKIKSQLIQARPISPSPYQYDMTSFYLGVETDGQFL